MIAGLLLVLFVVVALIAACLFGALETIRACIESSAGTGEDAAHGSPTAAPAPADPTDPGEVDITCARAGRDCDWCGLPYVTTCTRCFPCARTGRPS